MRPLGLHASDTHQRPRPDEEFAFTQLVDAALRHKVKYVLLAGDNFDRQSNRSRTVSFACRQIERLRQAGIDFVYIQGQHDADDPPWFSAINGTIHLHRRTVEYEEFVIYGLDWQPSGKLQEELNEIPPDVNFLIGHQVWGDWMGSITSPQGTFNQIPGHVRFVHTGDLHMWKLEHRPNADDEKMTVLSTGATTQHATDEPEEHYYALFYPDGKFERHAIKSRLVVDCGLMSRTEDTDRLIGELEPMLAAAAQKAAALGFPDGMERPYLRVTFSSKLTDVVRRVEKVVGDRAILQFRQRVPEDKQEAYAKAKSVAKGVAVTAAAVLKDEVDKEEQPAVYELCERMLAASDKPAEFAKWRFEFLGE